VSSSNVLLAVLGWQGIGLGGPKEKQIMLQIAAFAPLSRDKITRTVVKRLFACLGVYSQKRIYMKTWKYS